MKTSLPSNIGIARAARKKKELDLLALRLLKEQKVFTFLAVLSIVFLAAATLWL